ncbi:APC family permease [Candidatus Dependentiae bacterium]|nr:APC family permease [Candidatus Dependentiae bacterium]
MSRKPIPLTAAVLFVLNTMIGGGLFINPKQLAAVAGALSPIGYVIAALIMLPLILVIADLARLQPVSGGIYVYSKTYLNSFAGFISGWAYFLSKTTSAAFLLHTVNTFFCNHSAALQSIPPLLLDGLLIFLFAGFHIVGMTIGGTIQYVFSLMKFTPLIFGFIAGFVTFDKTNLTALPSEFSLTTLTTILPVCIYALVGFEIICSIGSLIENPSRNIRRTILIAFGFVSIVAISFQTLMFGSLGTPLAQMTEPMFALASKFLFPHLFFAKIMNGLVFAAISGGAFFMIGSNCWNVHTLAKNGHLPFANLLTKVNRFGAPWVALLVHACTSITMIGISSKQLPLQNMVVFGLFGAFFMSSLAAVQAKRKGLLNLPLITPILAIGTCSYILTICLNNIIQFGISTSFLSFFIGGGILALYMHFTTTVKQENQP